MEDLNEKINLLILKCFRLGQGGWNEEEDKEDYIKRAKEYAKEIGLLE
jgi:hypothetical protein